MSGGDRGAQRTGGEMSCRSLDDARADSDFWPTILRRTGRKLLDPEYVSNILGTQECERALLAEVDLGDKPHFMLLSFGIHRVWTIGTTVRHAPFSDGRPRSKTYGVLEWESARSLNTIKDGTPRPSTQIILAAHLLDAVQHPVSPRGARAALLRHAPNAGELLDLDELDAVGFLRVLDHLIRHDADPNDALATRRAFKHAIEMRDKVRQCFSRRLGLWDGEPIRDLGAK